jgi:tetratricopeptide (TPR) repeat protein
LLFSTVNAQTVPEDARRHMARGQAAVEMAKSPVELEDAIMEFQEAARLAPDWADPYYNLGMMQNKMEQFDDALKNLARYLQLAPSASNAGQVQELIYRIEYRRDKAAKRKMTIDALIGKAILRKGTTGGGACFVKKITRKGAELKANIWCLVSEFNQIVPAEFDGSTLKFKYTYYGCPNMPSYKSYPCPWEVSIAAEMIAISPLTLKVQEEWKRQFSGDYKQSYESEWEFNLE